MHKDSSNHIFAITELSEYIKSVIAYKKVRVNGEISQPKISGGHLYFSLKDESTNLKSIIWKSKNINKENIIDGQKITMDCNLDFYGGTGTVSLIVDKIITTDGSGELFLKYDKIKQDFFAKGYFDKSNKKQLPIIFKNILIITSENGAALQDFIYNLSNNRSNINYDIEDVIVQGIDCPKNICKILEKLKNTDANYDLVIITRGGGSFADLFGFSQPELIESIYNFHLPIMSAIGHQVDNPLIDLIADISAPTPSLAAQFIVDRNKKYIELLHKKLNELKGELLDDLTKHQNLILKLNDRVYKIFISFTDLKNECQNTIRQDINNLMVKLSVMESKINMSETKTDITLYYKNIKIEQPEDFDQLLKNKSIIKLKWGNKEYKFKFIE